MNISVIIPTYNEAAVIEVTVQELAKLGFEEIIVADGQSTDATPQLAGDRGAIVISSERGRARQMNAGAAASSGEVLLFLHADTHLPPGASRQIDEVLREPEVLGGAFHLKFDMPGFRMWLQSFASNIRSYYAVPFGDQAIFVRRDFFFKTGGYKNWKLMEDVDLARRIKKMGRLKMIRTPVVTSGRRFVEQGFWRSVVRNQMLLIGYYIGIPPDCLARFYSCP